MNNSLQMPQILHKTPVMMTLAVATVGRTEEVIRLLDSLTQQKNASFEVILADQNQDDRLKPIVQSAVDKGMHITHVRLDKPDQYAARTTGIEMAKGRYIAFPDDDCWYEPGAIDQAIQAFESSGADGLVIKWREAKPVGGELMEGFLRWDDARKFRINGTGMITQFYRTDVVRAIGGFDKRIGLGQWFGGGEDTDLFFSVLRHGMKVFMAPEVVVRHRYDLSSTNKPDFKRIRSRSRGTGALYVKHNIPLWVVLRGFLAPIIQPIIRLSFGVTLASGWAQSLGRIEGYFNWKFGKK